MKNATALRTTTPISLGTQLKAEIESYFTRFQATSPLFLRAARGELRPDHIVSFIRNIHYLIFHTPIFLELAIHLSNKQGRPDLASFYEVKMSEEQEHHLWAESDLRKLSERFGDGGRVHVLPGMRGLVGYIFDRIDRDPFLYLAYIIFAEHFTVLATPPWTRHLETKCGIPPSMLTVLGNHAELDKGHVVEMIENIDALVDPRIYAEPFLETVLKTADWHARFCAEVATP